MTDAQEKMVLDNLRIVHYCIKKYIHINAGNQDYEDYYQEGCVGLIEAVYRYNPDKGFKFSTFCTSYVFGYLLDYRNLKLPLIKYPRSRIDNRTKISSYIMNNPDATSEDMMRDLDMSSEDIITAFHNVEYYEDFTYINKDGEEESAADTIIDPTELNISDQFELSRLYDDIDDILNGLEIFNERNKQILIEYVYDLMYIEDHRDRNTQQYYADKYKCSRQRVNIIIKKGMSKLASELIKYGYNS